MSVSSLLLVAVSLCLTAAFFHPALMGSRNWRATVTPLASIIGSGFLVCGPILAHAAGRLAWIAMGGLCALGYLFGAAIRQNILVFNDKKTDGPFHTWIERVSDWTLLVAYFISVAYYLNLFAAFGLRLGGLTDEIWIRACASIVIAIVGAIGFGGGLRALERLEIGAVGIKLCVIGGLFAALLFANASAAFSGDLHWPQTVHAHGAYELQVLIGLVILVQGFETSRYLGAEYDAETRVKTMRRAQWISSAIYVIFILLVSRYFDGDLPEQGGETAIIDMLAPLGVALAPTLILAALASQLSAAVADMNGAGGLANEATRDRLSVNWGNALCALVAIAIIWLANIYEIIAYASKAFVAYYALQSAQAAHSAFKQKRYGAALIFGFAVLIAILIVIFAIPAEA